MKTLKVVLAGIGGYGRHFYEEVVYHGTSGGLVCAAVIQPTMSRHLSEQTELAQRKIPVYATLDQFFEAGGRADLVIIASPLPFHFEQCETALQNGAHVLCEKPVTVGWREALILHELSRKKGLVLAVGYQNSFSDAILRLKEDVAAGRYGRALSLSTLLLSGRSTAYYARSGWAGKMKDDKGRLVLDGIANNAGAHSLHLMLYLLGSGPDASAQPEALDAALARVNAIETYDLAALRIFTKPCSQVLFFGSHAYAGDPVTAYRFQWEKGWMTGDFKRSDTLVMHTEQGDIPYGQVALDALKPLHDTVDAIRRGICVPCGVHAAAPQAACIQGLHTAVAVESIITPPKIEKAEMPDGQVYWQAPQLNDDLRVCFDSGRLPHELGFPGWTAGSAHVEGTNGQQVWERTGE